jgi:predicted nucleic acid-binding protein
VLCRVGETSALFPDAASAEAATNTLGAAFSTLDRYATLRASETWRNYRKCGGSQSRMIADFLIGGHASLQADRLLTRDRGVYRGCFPNLTVIDPVAGR